MLHFTTPRALARRSDFYHQMAVMLQAGVSVRQALTSTEFLARGIGQADFKAALKNLEQGHTLTESLRLSANLPGFDFALLEAGEYSGRLDNCLELLASYYRLFAQLSRTVLAQMAYPMLIFHVAVFIAPVPALVQSGSLAGYLRQTLGTLMVAYLAILAVVVILQTKREPWRSGFERLIRIIPGLGSAFYELALARLAFLLEGLISAGVSILKAWPMAAGACGSKRLGDAVDRWQPQLEQGETPGELLLRTPEFPHDFASHYATAEVSGQLDKSLNRLARQFQEQGTHRLEQVAAWSPKIIYGLVVIYIVIQIFKLAGAAF